MQKCCWDCCKFIVFIVNFAALLAVGAVLGGAIYLLIESKDILGCQIEPNLEADNDYALHFSLFLIVFVVFGFLTIFTFLGCCGSACQSNCMIGSFVIILFIFFGANVGGIVYMYLKYPNEVAMATDELGKTIGYYDPSDDDCSINKFLWDKMQETFQCCGADGWSDWSAAEKLKNGEQFPTSCCINPNECSVYSTSANNNYMIGCVQKLELPFRIVFWALPSVMAFMLLASLIVCSGQKSREDRHAKNRNSRHSGDYSEETGYVYRASATPDYPTAPPYNPDYPAHQNPYAEQYPTGVIPPNAEYRQPLIQPPPYHDVISARR